MGVSVLLADAGVHHSDCRYRHVPVHYAIKHGDEREPDHVGCDLQPADAEPDDLRGDCLRTDYSGLLQEYRIVGTFYFRTW